MPQSKILVDTNSYLRLAKTIRPLLFVPFGSSEYCLYILPELNDELCSCRLENLFPWTFEDEYRENRKHFPTVSRKQKKSIEQTFGYLWDYVLTELPGPSEVDALYIAYGLELDVPVVTDDKDMTQLAGEFGAPVMRTLELLKVMYDCNHVSLEAIKGLCEYWRYSRDMPYMMDADFKKFFP